MVIYLGLRRQLDSDDLKLELERPRICGGPVLGSIDASDREGPLIFDIVSVPPRQAGRRAVVLFSLVFIGRQAVRHCRKCRRAPQRHSYAPCNL